MEVFAIRTPRLSSTLNIWLGFSCWFGGWGRAGSGQDNSERKETSSEEGLELHDGRVSSIGKTEIPSEVASPWRIGFLVGGKLEVDVTMAKQPQTTRASRSNILLP
jgi:hypothetical protein